ncbi:MAG: serine/threonine-protein kinase, partial [Planctomycetia bacterium]
MSGSLRHLADDDWNRLQDVVERFESDCADKWPRDLANYAPAVGDPLRAAVLCELARTDLELGWRRGRGKLVEEYLQLFNELNRPDTVVSLLFDEYQVRHQYGDRPPLVDYERRFPVDYPALCRLAAPATQNRKSTDTDGPPNAGPAKKSPTKEGPAAAKEAPSPDDPRIIDADQISRALSEVVPGDFLLDKVTSETSSFAGGAVMAERFERVRLLGEGGFGEVWESIGPGGIHVAIKRIHGAISEQAVDRERASLDLICSGKLRHPFLLQVFCWWIHQERLYIVMELAESSLNDRLKECQKAGRPGMSREELQQLMIDAAAALDFLNHKKNILHRDVKPANMLLMGGRLKLCDFGLSRMSEDLARLTGQTTQGAGTPAVIAPEIINGYQSMHSDQYSLAATYFMLRTGRPIFRGSIAEVRRKHLDEPPNFDDPVLTNAERRALKRGLAKSPKDRFANSTELVAALFEDGPVFAVDNVLQHSSTIDQFDFEEAAGGAFQPSEPTDPRSANTAEGRGS